MAADDESGLNLVWSFGFSSWISNSVHDLHPSRPNCLVAAAGLHAVIYNYVAGQQQFLIGHTSAIGAIATSSDRTVIVTAESQGHADGLVIVWEAKSGLPLATRNLSQGVVSVCSNSNGSAAALLTAPDIGGQQHVLLWSWSQNHLVEVELAPASCPQFQISWNPTGDDLCITNPASVVFICTNRDPQGALRAGVLNHCRVPASGHSGSRGYGRLQHSVHIPNSNEVLSGTDTGSIVVWAQHFAESQRTFVKAVPLGSSSPVTFIDVVNQLIAVASKDQALRFLDLQFRILFWFEDFAYGPINSLSFAPAASNATIVQAGVTITIPEFVFATSHANVVKITAKSIQALPNPSAPRGYLLVKGFGDNLSCIAAHPAEPLFAVGTQSGSFQLIDYADRTIQFAKQFNGGSQITAMAFSKKSESRSLAIALTSSSGPNQIQVCSLQNRLAVIDHIDVDRGSMHLLSFSICDSFLVMASSETAPGQQDQRHVLYLYERVQSSQKWTCLGRAQPHSQQIIQIEFDRFRLHLGRCQRLISLSVDHTVAVIDLLNSNSIDGVRVVRTMRLHIDPAARPVSMHVHVQDSNFMLTLSDSFAKIRTFVERQSDGHWICIRTGSAPVNDGHLSQHLIPLPSSNGVMGYCSSVRFLGLMSFPAGFNQSTAVIGHDNVIDQVVVGFDGNVLISSDSKHQCVHLWRIDLNRFQSALSSNAMSFLEEDLDRIRHMISYAVLKQGGHGGESKSDTLVINQIVNVMSALGCYLSGQDIRDIWAELNWAANPTQACLQDLGRIPDGSISLHDFIDFWLRHRTARPEPDMEAVFKAFRVLGANSNGEISFDALLSQLERNGEHLSKAEFEQCYQSIHPAGNLSSVPATITPAFFIQNILNLNQDPTS